MKKTTSLLVFGLIFSGFLVIQILFSFSGLHAIPASKEKGQHTLFEEVYQKAEFTSVDGQSYKLSKSTAPVVILNFWASWCRPCLEEMPSLVQLKKKYADSKVLVLGINSDEEEQATNIKKIQAKYGLNFPIVADKAGAIVNQFMLTAIPVSIIYHKGKVMEIGQGSKDFYSAEMIQKIEQWIAEGASTAGVPSCKSPLQASDI